MMAFTKSHVLVTELISSSPPPMPHAVLSTTMCEEKKALKERLGAILKK
jgi:hypothetical protein